MSSQRREKILHYDTKADDGMGRVESEQQQMRPANPEAEMAMLGAILINNEVFPEIFEIAKPKDCYLEETRMVYGAMRRLYERDEPIEIVTLVDEMEQTTELEKIGGSSYLTQLFNACVSSWNGPNYARIVARLAHKRAFNDDIERIYAEATQLNADPQTLVARLSSLVDAHQERLDAAGQIDEDADINAHDLMKLEIEDILWPIDSLMPEGLTIIGAPPKTGKSALALQLALSVATGGPVLGKNYAPTLQGDVLYLALEDSRKRLKARIYMQMVGEDAPSALTLRTKSPTMLQGGLVKIEAWLRKHDEARMVIIDTLGRFRGDGSLTENGNAYNADYQDLARLQSLALKHHVAIVVLHHLRKNRNDGDDVHEMLSGTSGISGAADCSWILERKREEDQGQLHITGRDMDEQVIAVKFSKNNLTWMALGDANEVNESAASTKIFEALRSYGRAATPSEIAAFTGDKRAAIQMRCLRMKDTGKLISVEGGKYWFSSASRQG